jgi:ABC-type branched-subunit amino acid transport system ATPase component
MARIKKLVIDGYRGIDHFEYEPNMINILVGRNNTGKSSILEAAAITYTAPTGFQDRLGNNILEKIIERKGVKNLEYFVNLNKDGRTFQLAGLINGIELKISISYKGKHQKFEIPKPIYKMIEEYAGKRRYKSSLINILEDQMLIGLIEPINSYFAFIPHLNSIFMAYAKILISRAEVASKLIFIGHNFEDELDVKNLYEVLLPTGELYNTLNYIRVRIPDIYDIRSDGERVWIYLEKLPRPLPISMVGDGFRETIQLLFIASLIQGGVLLVEEPENNLHPGLYEVVAERLVEVVREDRTQVFLSTHNLEFAEKLLRSGGELVNVVRLYRVKDELAYEVLSHGEALEELDELRIDLRGP